MSPRNFRYDAQIEVRGPALTCRRLTALLARRGIPTDGLRITEHSRSGRNRLFLIEGLEGTTWMAKQNLVFSGAETWFYTQAAADFGAAPGCLFAEPSADLVVVAYLAGAETLQQRVRTGGPAVRRIFGSDLAPLLVRLHALGAALPEVPAGQSPFPDLDPVDIRFWAASSPAARALITFLQKRTRLAEAYRRALQGAGPRGLIHGDLKPDNVLWSAGRCLVVDWECCGQGALGWDLGAVVGTAVMHWIDALGLGAHRSSAENGGSLALEDVCDFVRRFVTAYLEHAARCGLAAPDREVVSAYAAAWIVGRSWAEAAGLYRPAPSHPLRLLVAEALLDDPGQLFGDLVW